MRQRYTCRIQAPRARGLHVFQRHGTEHSVSFVAATEPGLQTLAAGLAADLQPGDTYLLQGNVGAGKTAFRHAWTAVRL